MSEYKGTKGFTIQNYTTDPDNPLEGQVWYNDTTGALKVGEIAGGSWATGGDLNTARRASGASGTQTAALGFGGGLGITVVQTLTESYNGSAWTEVNDLNTARTALGGSGTQTAALAFAGGIPPSPGPLTLYNVTESWNGTSWTTVPGTLNSGRKGISRSGTTSTDVLAFTGETAPSPNSILNESYNGTTWTELADLNTARFAAGGAGSGSTDAVCYGGGTPGALNESWNGSSWTEVGDLNVPRGNMGGGVGTVNTAALAFGGQPGPSAILESWNGTSWTVEANPVNGGETRSGTGTATSALAFGGFPDSVATEEWNGPTGAVTGNTITTD